MSGPREPEQHGTEPGPERDDAPEPDAAPEAPAPSEHAAEPVDDAHHGRHAGGHLPDDADDGEAHQAEERGGPAPAGEPAMEPAKEPATTGGLRGWSGLRTLLRPRLNTSQLIVAVLCAALGFALIVQVNQNQSDNLSSLRQSDLVRLLDDVTQRTQTLEREQSDLTATRDQLKSSSGSRQAAIDLATQRAQTQGILSGRLPAQGPGIRLTITQGTQVVGAATMFNVLEELRNAGAEAVQVGDVRLVASSWFEVHGDTLVADGQPLESPYVWLAIGDPDTLAPALGIPGGALAAVRNTGATADVTTPSSVEVKATREPGTPQYATPTPLVTGGGS
ncbi:DUF881 domain-containing protein [Luteimicrobium sp. DT211]|uniref:DUF881 domain-containing protein n=1 Tax=Luteimicrobium sp. DT211 TaxID=3393412 RepID=UPI003CF142F7